MSNLTKRIGEFTSERSVGTQIVRGTDSTIISAKAGGIGAFLKTTQAWKRGLQFQ